MTTVFVHLGNTKIELLHPLGEKSPIQNFLDKNKDGGIHHICIEVRAAARPRPRSRPPPPPWSSRLIPRPSTALASVPYPTPLRRPWPSRLIFWSPPSRCPRAQVANIREAIRSLKDAKVRPLTPEPKIGAHGKPVVFLHPKDCNGVLVELEEA